MAEIACHEYRISIHSRTICTVRTRQDFEVRLALGLHILAWLKSTAMLAVGILNDHRVLVTSSMSNSKLWTSEVTSDVAAFLRKWFGCSV